MKPSFIHSTYYPHIDGLRALAVLPVLFYHMNAAFCSGGFAGVDIFFVISGYLITHNILKDLGKGTFHIANFYDRRIRRIIPAYTFLIVSVLIAAPFFYYTDMIRTIGDTALSSTFFASNFYFYFNLNYFTFDGEPNPFLNLWSLSVEEQFYIFLPIVLWLGFKFFKKGLLALLCVGAFVSFGVTAYALLNSMFVTSSFYLLPFRAWELLAGSLLAYTAPLSANQKVNIFTKSLALLTVVALFASYYTLTKYDAFPGLNALPFVLAGVILIKFGAHGPAGAFLTSRPIVFVGKISYSLYLWHWPIIIFWKYVCYGVLTPLDYALIFALSMLMAILSWRFVELPVRKSKTWTKKRSFILLATTTLVILCIFAVYRTTDSFKNYLHTQTRAVKYQRGIEHLPIDEREPVNGFIIEKTFMGDRSKPATVLLIGDSHAEVFPPAFDEILREKKLCAIYIRNYTKNLTGVDYLRGTQIGVKGQDTETLMRWIAAQPHIKTVILAARWAVLTKLTGYSIHEGGRASLRVQGGDLPTLDLFELGLTRTCKLLHAAGKDVILLTSLPELKYHLPIFKQRALIFETDIEIGMTKKDYIDRQQEALAVLEKIEKAGYAKTIPVHNEFLEGEKFVYESEGGVLYYFDDDHLSREGARKALRPVMDYLLKKEGAADKKADD